MGGSLVICWINFLSLLPVIIRVPVNSFFFTQLDFGILCQQNAFVWFMICEAFLSFGLFLINFPVFHRVLFLVNPCLVVAFQFLVELIPIKKIQNLDSALVQTLLTARWKIVAFRTSARLSALFLTNHFTKTTIVIKLWLKLCSNQKCTNYFKHVLNSFRVLVL